jgi:hypothetical protein
MVFVYSFKVRLLTFLISHDDLSMLNGIVRMLGLELKVLTFVF